MTSTSQADLDTPRFLVLAFAGAAVVTGMVLYGHDSVQVLRGEPYLVIWLALVVLQGVLYGVLPPVLFARLRPHFPDLRRRFGGALVVAGFVIAFAAAVPLVTAQLVGPDRRLPLNLLEKWRVLNAAGILLVAVPAALGIFGVQCAADLEGHAKGGISPSRFLELRGRLSFFLAVLGAMVAVATLSAGVSRRAVLPELPPELMIAYGGHFTLLVALVYTPAHLTLSRIGRGIIGSGPPPPEVERAIQTDVRQALEASIPVFAPLLGGLLSLALR